jgi:hypothetical protein
MREGEAQMAELRICDESMDVLIFAMIRRERCSLLPIVDAVQR